MDVLSPDAYMPDSTARSMPVDPWAPKDPFPDSYTFTHDPRVLPVTLEQLRAEGAAAQVLGPALEGTVYKSGSLALRGAKQPLVQRLFGRPALGL